LAGIGTSDSSTPCRANSQHRALSHDRRLTII
jgi:hypothetical protein